MKPRFCTKRSMRFDSIGLFLWFSLSHIFIDTNFQSSLLNRPADQPKKNNDQKLCSWHLSQMFTIKAHRVKMMVGPRPWRIAEQYIWYCHSFHHIIRFCLQHNIIFQFNWIAKTARSICFDVLSFGLLCVYVLVFFSVLSSWRVWVCVCFLSCSSILFRFALLSDSMRRCLISMSWCAF